MLVLRKGEWNTFRDAALVTLGKHGCGLAVFRDLNIALSPYRRALSVGNQETARVSVLSMEVTLHFLRPRGQTPAGHVGAVGDRNTDVTVFLILHVGRHRTAVDQFGGGTKKALSLVTHCQSLDAQGESQVSH